MKPGDVQTKAEMLFHIHTYIGIFSFFLAFSYRFLTVIEAKSIKSAL
jgi:hypothetical protein